jgi:hypothetical protein
MKKRNSREIQAIDVGQQLCLLKNKMPMKKRVPL